MGKSLMQRGAGFQRLVEKTRRVHGGLSGWPAAAQRALSCG